MIFSHLEICSGDRSRISLLATILRNSMWMARRHAFGRKATPRPGDRLHSLDTEVARYGAPTCRLAVDTARCRPSAIARIEELALGTTRPRYDLFRWHARSL